MRHPKIRHPAPHPGHCPGAVTGCSRPAGPVVTVQKTGPSATKRRSRRTAGRYGQARRGRNQRHCRAGLRLRVSDDRGLQGAVSVQRRSTVRAVQRTLQPNPQHRPGLHAQRHLDRHAQQRHALLDAPGRSASRALVLTVPEVEKDRYYSVQLTDMYACNYGYIGSRATGNAAGRYLVAGPSWQGRLPRASTKSSAAKPSSAWSSTAPSFSIPPTSTT